MANYEELDMYAHYKPRRLTEVGLYVPESVQEYDELYSYILAQKEKRSISHWQELMRQYGSGDLYFLLNYILSDSMKLHNETQQPLYKHEVYRKYCLRTQHQLDNFISSGDFSSRSFSKTRVRTFASSIQLMVNYPNASQAIVSSERQLAARQFGAVLEELEANRLLKIIWDDIFYFDPRESAKVGDGAVFSKADGVRVKRTMTRMNNTLEHHAFIGSAPTGSRFDIAFFEDVESEKLVGSKEQLDKLHESLAAFSPLITPVAIPRTITVLNNTLYSPNGIAKKRFDDLAEKGKQYCFMYPAESGHHVNGRFVPDQEGTCPGGGIANYPFTERNLWDAYEAGGNSRVKYFTQMLGDLTGGEDTTFKREWIQFAPETHIQLSKGTNAYICIDASRGLQDPMGIWVWGAAPDKKLRWIDGARKKLDPASPAFHDEIFNIVMRTEKRCKRVVAVLVEQLPNQVWADLISSELRKRGCYTQVIACKGKLAHENRMFNKIKYERIWQRWAPPLQDGKIIFPTPQSMGGYGIPSHDEKGVPFDLVDYFLKFEYDPFPSPKHDDLWDGGGQIWDPEVPPIVWPSLEMKKQDRYDYFNRNARTTWMSAGG